MLYHIASPLYTLASLLVIGGIAHTAKTIFDYKMKTLRNRD